MLEVRMFGYSSRVAPGTGVVSRVPTRSVVVT